MATCAQCNLVFANRLQLGSHSRTCANVRVQPQVDEQIDAITVPLEFDDNIELSELAQREAGWGVTVDPVLSAVPGRFRREYCRDYRDLQEIWAQHVGLAFRCCDNQFWQVFQAVRTETGKCQDEVFQVVKKMTNLGHRFPSSVRVLRERVRL